jgi:predicted PurR-regulated permease PerM
MPLFLGLGLSIILFFLIFKFEELSKGFSIIMSTLAPFIYGGVLAYLLKTPYNWIEKRLSKLFKKKKAGLVKTLSLIIVLLAAILCIYLLLTMIIPALVDSFSSIAQAIPGVMTKLDNAIAGITSANPEVGNYIDTAINTMKTSGPVWIKDTILPGLTDALGGIVGVFGSLLGLLYNLILGLIICIYILLDKDNFARQAKMIIYSLFHREVAEKIIHEFVFIDKTFMGFFGGKVLDSAIVGLICYVFCLILQLTMGMHNAVLIAVVIGVTNIIPFFGPYIGCIPSAIIILIDSPICFLFFAIFIVFLQLFDGNVLAPKLLSESVGLSGFWVLFSIIVFGGLFGVTGILAGVPIFAVIYDLIRKWVYMMLNRHQITEYLPDSVKEDKPDQQVQG